MQYHAKTVSAVIALAFIGAMLVAPAMAQLPDRVNVPSAPLQTYYAEDFAEGDGGYTGTGSWEFGSPAGGPEIPEGKNTNIWGTNLAGDYPNNECDALESSAIDLSGVLPGESLELSFKHYTDTENRFDGAAVFLSADGVDWQYVTPNEGYDVGPFSNARACLGLGFSDGIFSDDVQQWRTATFDVTDYAGGDLMVRWMFSSDASVTAPGFFVDQVTVTSTVGGQNIEVPDAPDENDVDELIDEHVPDRINVPSVPLQTYYAEDFAEGDGGYTGDAPWEFGTPSGAPEIPEGKNTNIWGTTLAGDYPNSQCASLTSPAIDLSGVLPGESLQLSFKHYTDLENRWDGAVVFVSADGVDWQYVVPNEGYDNRLNSNARSCFGLGFGDEGFTDDDWDAWRTASFDVSEFAGGDLHVRWMFSSDSIINRLGFYVDQVTVQSAIGGQNIDVPDAPDPNEHLPERVNVPNVPLSTMYAEDFAEGDGGYTTGGVDSSWEFGEPTSPPNIPEGKNRNVWGMNLDGDYNNRECSYLQSAPIDLSGVPAGTAMLSFKHWIHARMSTFSGTAYDGGVVSVSGNGVDWTVIDPMGDGYNSDGATFSLRNCLGIGTDQNVFTSPQYSGSPGPDDWQVAEFDVSDFLGGDLHVRWTFGSTSSFSEARGWYVDQVAVQLSAGGQNIEVPEVPDLEDTPTLTIPAPGWTISGEDPSWQYGTVTDDDSDVDDFRGEVGFMTNLDGSHNNPECSMITSPVMPASMVAANPTLSFEQAYRIAGAFVNVAWGGGLVQVSLDGGLTWNYLDLPEYDRPLNYSGGYAECFTQNGAPLSGYVFSGVNTELHTVDVDLLDHFDQSDLDSATGVQFRFLFGADTFAYEGWFINHVDAAGVRILN